jgi:hypothetical protein
MWKGTLIRGNDPDTQAPVIAAIDAETKTLRVNNWVWDPQASPNPTWVRGKQATLELTGDLTVTLGDVERLLANHYYVRMKPYSYSSGRIKYICRNTDIDANETDTDWFCWKYTDASPPEHEGPREGAVNNEAAVNGLSWNI